MATTKMMLTITITTTTTTTSTTQTTTKIKPKPNYNKPNKISSNEVPPTPHPYSMPSTPPHEDYSISTTSTPYPTPINSIYPHFIPLTIFSIMTILLGQTPHVDGCIFKSLQPIPSSSPTSCTMYHTYYYPILTWAELIPYCIISYLHPAVSSMGRMVYSPFLLDGCPLERSLQYF